MNASLVTPRSLVVFGLATMIFLTAKLQAAEIPVYNTNNAFAGSLRQAILTAAPGDTIVFRIPKNDAGYNLFANTFRITLTGDGGGATIVIDKNLTIDGGGQKIVVQRSLEPTVPNFGLFFCSGGTVTFADLTLKNGYTIAGPGSGGVGGAIASVGSVVRLRNCTFVGNYAEQGGALYNSSDSTMSITNCTFSQNTSGAFTIANFGILTIDSTTISGNTAVGVPCGGVFTSNTGSSVARLRNTIVAGNFGNGSNRDVEGSFLSEGSNLIGNAVAATGFGAPGDQIGASAAQVNLGLLQDNGGPTETMALGAGSLATDQGKRGLEANGQPIESDQRNSPRLVDLSTPNAPGGDGSDIGALENGLPQLGPTFTVTNTAAHSFAGCTEDDCTLREALNASNAEADANVINFAPGVIGGIAPPSSAGFQIVNPVTINGPGARNLRLAPSTGLARIVSITAPGAVEISGLTIANGFVQSGSEAKGAGVFVASGNATLTDCVLTQHVAGPDEGYGGALYNAIGATVNLLRCTFDTNYAGLYGAGAYNEGTLVATNCTFTGNSALRGGAVLSRANGGAARMTLRNCTISGNSARDPAASPGFGGGGVFAEGNASQYFASNNIIAGNSGTNDPDIRGNYTSEGSNLIGKVGDSSGFLNGVNGDKVGTVTTPLSAQLGVFTANGGHTNTFSLLANSPAINSGNDAVAPAADQRRFARNGISDIGAFEFNGAPPPVSLAGAVSRKTHGSAGVFDINLPLTGTVGVECRSGGAKGDYTVIFSFTNALASVGSAAVTSGTGFVGSSQIGSDARQYVVNLSGIANAQRVTVTLFNVTDSLGSSSTSIPITLGVLIGDTTGNGSVSSTDIGQTKSQSGQPVTASNFRVDVTANGGSINASDIGLVKSRSGTQLP